MTKSIIYVRPVAVAVLSVMAISSWASLGDTRASYVDVPSSKYEAQQWLEPYDQTYLPYSSCTEINDQSIAVTGLREKVHYYWQSKSETGSWIDHYHCLFRIVEVSYNITCGNKLVYQGKDYLLSDTWKKNEAYTDDEERSDFKAQAHDWITLPLSSLKEDGSILDENGASWSKPVVKFDKNVVESKWSVQRVGYPEFKFVGTPGTLPRPVLLVHGLNSDFEVWGVDAKTPVTGKLKKSEVSFQNGEVLKYFNGSLPDRLARSQNLDNSETGINNNGIYFYQSPGSLVSGDWVDALPAWKRNDASTSQSRALYSKLQSVLDAYYKTKGIDWTKSSELDIDIVCHSQGGLVIREMLRGLSQDAAYFPVGSANPANHIRRIVTVNTPHFGTSLAASGSEIPSEYSGLAAIASDIDATTPASHTLVTATIDASFWERMGSGMIQGFNEGVDFGTMKPDQWYSLASAVTVPAGGLLGGFVGLFAGPADDIDLEITGPYLGPYHQKVTHINSTVKTSTIQGPSGFAQSLRKMRVGANHLAPGNTFINTLKLSGYPSRPDGKNVEMIPLYSEDMRPLLGQVLSQLSEDSKEICAESDESVGCFSFAEMLSNYALSTTGYALNDVDFDDELWSVLKSFQDDWLKNSDAVVDVGSQKFIEPLIGLSPDNAALGGAFKQPRTFEMHKALAPWEPVAHGPFDFNKDIEDLGKLEMDHEGASRQGLDLMCALSSTCSEQSKALMRVSANVSTIQIPILDPATSGTTQVSAQTLAVTGNFNFIPTFVDKGLQGVALSSLTGTPLVVAAYIPGKGSEIYWKDASGVEHKEQLLDAAISTQPSISRNEGVVTVTFTNYGGKQFTKDLNIGLTENVTYATLAEVGASMTPLISGNGTPVDPATQVGPRPPVGSSLSATSVAVLHREARGTEQNISRPRFLIQNISKASIQGYKVAYFFSADPARDPKVEIDYPQTNFSVEHLGGDLYKLVIDMTNQTIAAGDYSPNKDGWQIRIHYNDWTTYKYLDDWSADYSIGNIKLNRKVVVYDAAGKILWGTEPAPYQSQNVTGEAVPVAMMSWVDKAPWETNILKPEVTIQNTGTVALKNYHALLYFKIPAGKTLVVPPSDWYTPESDNEVRALGNGLFVFDMNFNKHILYAGQTVVEGNVGLNLNDWSAFDKSFLGMALIDENGNIIYGAKVEPSAIPEEEPVIPNDIDVLIRDEAINSYNQPQIRFKLVNKSNQSVSSVKIGFDIVTENELEPFVNSWYPPNCNATKVHNGATSWTINLQCENLGLASGGVWPNNDGAVFGLHYSDWSAWDRTNDPSLKSITADWANSIGVTISNIGQ